MGERGGRLSAGQRQLVSFARAFLADPAVLVLDEATSSLDVPSERLVQHALRTLLADRTALIIAHRLSTVEIADRVLVMEAGQIVEDGAPAALAVRPGSRYRAMLEAEEAVREGLWSSGAWRRLWLEGGLLFEDGRIDAKEEVVSEIANPDSSKKEGT